MSGAATILICDDEASLRELVRAVLDGDYGFLEAGNGLAALELVREAHPDLVVLDLMLPGMSGLDVLERLRSEPEFGNPPVVVVTAWDHAGEQALAAGAERVLAKPFDPEELIAMIEELLGRR